MGVPSAGSDKLIRCSKMGVGTLFNLILLMMVIFKLCQNYDIIQYIISYFLREFIDTSNSLLSNYQKLIRIK